MITAKEAYVLAEINTEAYLIDRLDEFYAAIKKNAEEGFYSNIIELKNNFTYRGIVEVAKLLYYDGYDVIIYGDEKREKFEKIEISWDLSRNKYAEIWYTYGDYRNNECSENLVAKYKLERVKKEDVE